jgi:hypothetical protein
MISFIDDHRQIYWVEPICKVLPIAPSTYYAHVVKRADPEKLSARARRDIALPPDDPPPLFRELAERVDLQVFYAHNAMAARLRTR